MKKIILPFILIYSLYGNAQVYTPEVSVQTMPNNNIGIGANNTSPLGKLDILHTGTLGGRWNPANAYLKIGDGTIDMLMDGNEIFTNHNLHLGVGEDKEFTFRTVSQSSTNRLMTLKGDGKLGIGTTSPEEELEVAGKIVVGRASKAGQIKFRRDDGSANGKIGFPSSNKNHFDLSVSSGSAFITFSTNSSSDTGTLERMRIHSNGYVGIGTNSPTELLEVDGKAKFYAITGLNEGGGGGSISGNNFNISGVNKLVINDPGEGIDFHGDAEIYVVDDSNDNKLYIDAAKIGISKTNPSYKLDISGSIRYTSGGLNGSDLRWKSNIRDLENAGEELDKIRPVSYWWKKDEFPSHGFDERQHYGVIAQELENILPELVDTDEDGYKSVEYTSLIALLIAGYQERTKELKEYKELVERLHQEMEILKQDRIQTASKTGNMIKRLEELEKQLQTEKNMSASKN